MRLIEMEPSLAKRIPSRTYVYVGINAASLA